MRSFRGAFLIAQLLWLSAASAFAQRELKDIPDPDPELERQTFIMPEGFRVSLFAADPQMAKPIQINFDAQGRLWVASSEVYPQVKPGEVANDKVLVLEDTDGDGEADKTTVFADGLLIPTGVIAGDGGAYVVNSTELLHLRDTDGDGKADTRSVVLSGFGTEDTHHLLHTLRWGHDGCLYMNQSIYIHSHVETPYGVRRLNGGGIWRFRPETLELDVMCRGFVNSWGHHFDAWGQSFATDGAYHEGINYVFPGSVFVTAPGAKRIVSGLNPGSPKHCGLEVISGPHFPDDWQGNMITNDFRAHRVCRFVVTEDGSGYASRQEVELIKSSHVAFRPIDAKMGPDGALYIADWYNPIIQHGEVDFRDPRRDHVHGRIWRVTIKDRPLSQHPDLAAASNRELLELLKRPEEWLRLQAKLTLKQRALQEGQDSQTIARDAQDWLTKIDLQDSEREHHRLEVLWLFQNLRLVKPELLEELLHSQDHRVRAAAVRVAVDWRDSLPNALQIFQAAAGDEHPRVRLEAVRALSLFPDAAAAIAALQVLERPMDRFLDFALWQTIRDLEPVWLPALQQGKVDLERNVAGWLYAFRAVESPGTVPLLLKLIRSGRIQREQLDGVLELVAARGGPPELSSLLDVISDGASTLTAAEKAALLDGLVQTTQVRRIKPAGDLQRVAPLLEAPSDELRRATARAAGAWKVESLEVPVRKLAVAPDSDSSVSRAVRDGAIDALVWYGGQESIAALTNLAARERSYENRQRAVAALVGLDVSLAARFAVELLQSLPPEANPADVITPLLGHKQGPASLREALGNQSLPADVAKLVLRAAQGTPTPSAELLDAIRSAGKLADTGWKKSPELVEQLVAEVQMRGDPVRGEAIFRRSEMQCLKCHSIAGAGGRVGSDLISLGATAQIDYIIESLLDPNAKVKEGYHSKLVVTDEGRVITGIPVRETATELVLRDAEDREVAVPVAGIEEKKDGRSLMPDGAVDLLTRTELVDLVRFLSELGKVGGRYAVGNARFARRWQTLAWSNEAHRLLNRTSHDTAATDQPVFHWQSVYSQVSGELPLRELPKFQPHADTEPSSFVRCQMEVTTSGRVKLSLNSVDGLAMWLDGKPISVKPALEFRLEKGVHVLTFDINHTRRSAPLSLQLLDSPEAAQVQLIGGK